ncbi:hypothetical protein BD414DRAFT_396837, partial [Trametes punicea]
VNWQSSDEISKDNTVFVTLIEFLLGLYIWEIVISLSFQGPFLTGRRRFKWPLIFYFGGRYSFLLSLIGIQPSAARFLTITRPIDCQAISRFFQVLGNASIGFASINFSLRTMVVWSWQRPVVIFLVLASLGHWSLLMLGVLIKAKWVPGHACVFGTDSKNTLLAGMFIYTTFFDLTVLLLMMMKLGASVRCRGRSRLVVLIVEQGLIFNLTTVLTIHIYALQTFMLMNLNNVMSVIATVPAAAVSTV